MLVTPDKAPIEFPCLILQHGAIHSDTSTPKLFQTSTGNLGIGVHHRIHYPRYTRQNQRFHTGRGTAVMAARLKCDIRRGTFGCGTCLTQSMNFRVGLTGSLMPAFPDHPITAGDDTTHHRIGLRSVATPARQLHCSGHQAQIKTTAHRIQAPLISGRFFSSRSSSARNSLRS